MHYQIGTCLNPNLSPNSKLEVDTLDMKKLHLEHENPPEETDWVY